MMPAELKAWCNQLREDVLRAPGMERVWEAQRGRLHAGQEWLAPFAEYTARFGGKVNPARA